MDNQLAATTAPASVARAGEPARRRNRVAGWPLSADVSAAAGLFAAALAFYYPLVFLGRALVDYDAFVYFFPQRVYLARSLLAGQIPLWDPDLFLGAPFLANPQTAVLYPPSWLFLIGPVATMYTAQLVLHGFLAAFFTYLLARHALGVHPLAGALGGLAYAFGGFAIGQAGHLNQISAAAWLPAVLLAYDRFAVTRRASWLALGALAIGLQLFAGHPQESYMTIIVLGLFGVVRAPWRTPRSLLRCALGGVGMCALGGAFSAAQLLPTLELAPLSIRGEGVNWRDAVAGSLPAYLSVRALFPPFWMNVPYTEYLGYVGVTALVLGLLAVMLGRSRMVLFGGLTACLGLFLALGENNGYYPWVFASVPGFDTFRVPARWLLLWEFGAAILAALGADWIARGALAFPRRRTTWARALLVVLILVAGLAWQRDEGEPFAQRRTPIAFAAIAAAALAAAALPHLGRPVLAIGMLLGMTAAELGVAADAFPARQAPPPAYTRGETVDWLQARGVTNQERLLSLARPEYMPAAEDQLRAGLSPLPNRVVESVLVAQKWHDTLTPNVPLQFGLNTADGYDGGVLPLLRWLRLSSVIVQSPRPDGVLLTRLQEVPSDQQLDLLGVRYLIANAGTPARAGLQTVDFGDLRLFARADPVPRSLVVFSATTVADEAAALQRLSATDFDSSREVVLERSAGEAAVPAGSGTTPTAAATASAPAVAVNPQETHPERWRARIALPQAGYLLQREAWYPGWRARIDGADAPLLRADVLFRAVAVPAGDHQIEIVFDSDAFRRGAILSLASLFVIIAVLIWPRLPRMFVRADG